jgi:tetratricopeptide (TPR) repeat protein
MTCSAFRRRAWSGAMLVPFLFGLALAQNDGDLIEPYKPLPSTALVLTARWQATGFLVDRADRLVLTNNHVVQTNQNVEAIFPITTDDGRIFANRDFYLKKAQRIRGKCLDSTPVRDLAILQLQSVPATVPEVKLASQAPREGDRTHLLGNPANNTQVWVYGFGKVKTVGAAKLDSGEPGKEARVMVLTTEDRKIGPGASGGPVVNDAGELVGVIRAGAADSRQITCIDSSEVRIFLGEFFRKQGTAALANKDYNEAIARCSKAIEINASDALAYNERGAAYAFQRSFEEAIKDYSLAVKHDPKLSRAWRGRATAYYFLGKYQKAVADCTQAIEVDPEYAQAYLSRSRAHKKLGKTAEAKADYDAAVKLDPALK